MPPLNPYDQLFIRRQAALTRKILSHFEGGIQLLTPTLSTLKYKGIPFRISDYPALQKKVDQVTAELQNKIYTTTVNGIQESWSLSNKKTDVLVDKRLAGKRLKKNVRQALYDPNAKALEAFISRKEKGMDLSKRVWKSVEPFKKEIEQTVGIGVGKGQSAQEMARELKRNLQEPDRLFRRVRGEDGKLYLSQSARNYHPGQGVYRSSFKNSMRVARTETNGSYRTADHERWKTLPFVKGIEIRLSSAHPKVDICDTLVGMYPKDFKFQGWHPQCLCFAIPEMMSDDEYDKIEDHLLAGQPITVPSSQLIQTPPPAFGKYLQDNKEMLARLKSEPYWMRDNKQYLEMKPIEVKKVEKSINQISTQFTKIESRIEKPVNHALKAIDEVHGDGILDDIPFKYSKSSSYNAQITFVGRNAQNIKLTSTSIAPEVSIAHEMGHYLDYYSVGERRGFASAIESSPAGKVVKAAKDTETIKNIDNVLSSMIVEIEGKKEIISRRLRKHLRYLQQDHEIFARAYAQYIAEKSGSKVMKDGIDKVLSNHEKIGYSHQWPWKDFKAISEAFDEMLKDLGWVVSL